MTAIALVPARCGSKSIALKNIKDFCGRPLLHWVVQALDKCPDIDEVHVATDCEEISSLLSDGPYKKVVVFQRSAENATDDASTEALLLEFLAAQSYQGTDKIVLAQVTTPFTTAADIGSALSQIDQEKADSLLTATRFKRFLWDQNCKPINYDPGDRPRRQDMSGQLLENGAFYISSVSNILASKSRLSGKITIFEMPEYAAIELDEPADWIMAETIFRYNQASTVLAQQKVKLFLTDVDGVLTDAGMYYAENGDEFKKFHTHDGMGLQLLQKEGIPVGLITSEDRQLNRRRAEKLSLDYAFHGEKNKLDRVKELCDELAISLAEIAYIGDDINDLQLLSHVGVAACPENALPEIKQIDGIIHLKKRGGQGAVREFANIILQQMNYD